MSEGEKITGVTSVIGVAAKGANDNLGNDTSEYINKVATLYPELAKAIGKGKTKSAELDYGQKNGIRVVPEKNKKQPPKEINKDAFYGGLGLDGMDSLDYR